MKAFAHSRTRVLGYVVAGLGLAALAVQPLAAHAAIRDPMTMLGGPVLPKTTMYESYRVFPKGTKVPGSGSTTSVLVQGKNDTLTAPTTIPGKAPGSGYQFLFWDIAGQLYTSAAVSFTAPPQATFKAQAWYLPEGGCTTAPCPPPPPPQIGIYAFSLIKTRTLAGTPIKSVDPSSAQIGPKSISTTSAVTITAASYMPLKSGAESFVRWLPFISGSTATGPQLSVGAGVYGFAIAFYGIDPCQSIRNNPPQPGDFPTQALFQAAMRAWAASLHACEVSHGLPTS